MSRPVKHSSNKSFGITFAVVFLVIAAWPFVLRGDPPYLWAIVLAMLFGGAAFLAPRVLTPLNRLWFRFGLLLHGIVNPIVMALLYYLAVVPMGLIVRIMGKDLLRLRRDQAAPSYWLARDPPGPAPGSMTKQF